MVELELSPRFCLRDQSCCRVVNPLPRKLLILTLAIFLLGAGDPYPSSPEEVVVQYLEALKNADFPRAYLYLSNEMNAGKDVWNWAIEQKQLYKYAEAEIFGYEVYEATIEGSKAYVPNILKSRDNIINKSGADEYELYTLRKSGGDWVIDRQKLVPPGKREHWFKRPYPG